MAPSAPPSRIGEPGAFRVVAESVQALRVAPLATLACYYTGAVPFVAAFLYYWADLTSGLVARTRNADAALVLAALFLWMKFWQTVFCARLRAQVLGVADEPWRPGRVVRTFCGQAMFQTAGLFVLPAALVTLVGFPAVYCTFQNATVLGAAPQRQPAESLAKRSWRQAVHWPRQACVLVWALCPWLPVVGLSASVGLVSLFARHPHLLVLGPFVLLPLVLCPVGLALAANLAIALAAGPMLLRSLLGIETAISLAPAAFAQNTTFLATVCGIVYLCLDPAMKAACVLRCHYGESLATGEDLMADLAAARAEARDSRSWTGPAAALALVLCLAAAPSGRAEAPGSRPAAEVSQPAGTVDAASLDRAVSDVLTGRLYQWRMPPAPEEQAAASQESRQPGWFETFLNSVDARMRRFADWCGAKRRQFDDWVRRTFGSGREHRAGRASKPSESSASDYGFLAIAPSYLLLFALLAAVLVALALLLLRRARLRRQKAEVQAQPAAAIAQPDLESDDIRADRLPTDEWLVLARELAARGEYRLALRALFLSGLAWLAARDLLRIARAKSNREYERELRRRAHSWPGGVEAFAGNVRTFEAVWYGDRPADAPLLTDFERQLERMRHHAE